MTDSIETPESMAVEPEKGLLPVREMRDEPVPPRVLSEAEQCAQWLEGGTLCDDSVDWARQLEASAAELRRLSAVEARCVELEAYRDSWMKQADHRVDDVLEQAHRAELAEQKCARQAELLQQAKEALLYHVDQTRPIDRTSAALSAINEWEQSK